MEKTNLKTLKLDNILEKLKKIDIRAWEFIDYYPSTEINGIIFIFSWGSLLVKDRETGYSVRYSYNGQNKDLRKRLKEFYEEINTSVNEYHRTKLEEKIEDLLSD